MRLIFFTGVLTALLFCGCKKDIVYTNDTGAVFYCQTNEIAPGVQIGDIYQSKNFAAFTDIAYFNGMWYCVFRIGTENARGEDGQIKVLTSKDGSSWTVSKIISIDNFDLRGPHLVIDSSKNDLFLTFLGSTALKYGQIMRRNYLIKYDKDTNDWGGQQQVHYDHESDQQYFFWRYTFHNGNMYCAAYNVPIPESDGNGNLRLFVSSNTSYTNYKNLGDLSVGGLPTETTLRFYEKDSMYLIPRTEKIKSPIGYSTPVNYSSATWLNNPFATVLASPNFLFYHQKLLVTGRDSNDGTFKFFAYDMLSGKVEKMFIFPAGFETGYGGMSFNPSNPDELWVTYYSIADSGSSIKLAKINLPEFL